MTRKIFFFVCIVWIGIGQAAEKQVIVDVNSVLGPFTLRIGTNGGPKGIISNNDYTDLFHELGFDRIRAHDYYGPVEWYRIFPNWEADPEDPASYNFDSTDEIIQSIVNGGFDILYRIGPSWHDELVEYHNDPPGTIRDSQGNILHEADSTDFAKFASICKHIIMHYNEGWGNGYHYDIRKWEIWNEPFLADRFWSGTPTQFFMMFATVAKTLKSYDSSLEVGGPGLAGYVDDIYCDGLISYCRDHQVPLDFFSWHSYGGRSHTPVDYLTKGTGIRDRLDQYGFTETKSICDEWNAGINVAYFGDSGKGAAYYVSSLTYFVELGLEECYQYRGDDHPLGLVKSDDSLRIAAEALRAWQYLTKGTVRLQASGTDSLGFAVLASISASRDTVWILLSNFPDETQQVNLSVENLVTVNQDDWIMKRYVINQILRLVPVDSRSLPAHHPFSFIFPMQPESVHLLQFTTKPASGIDQTEH